MKNLPIPLLTFLAAQVGAAVWWGAQIDAKVKLVEENRRYIQEVVIPSYEIKIGNRKLDIRIHHYINTRRAQTFQFQYLHS